MENVFANLDCVANSRLSVFTDLDGTLLDHDTYSFEPALITLTKLATLQIPVVFNTSKTFRESNRIAMQMKLAWPFVIENGGAIVTPSDGRKLEFNSTHPFDRQEDYDYEVLGSPISEILEAVDAAKQSLRLGDHIHGFSDMSVNEVIRLTGLSQDSAIEAKSRQFSEPLVWSGSAEQLRGLVTFLADRALRLVRGGRFYHVIGHTDKRTAMVRLLERFQQATSDAILSVALGDSDNDIHMLMEADIAVLIRNDATPDLVIDHPNLIKTERPGPAGWSEALDRIIAQHQMTTDKTTED